MINKIKFVGRSGDTNHYVYLDNTDISLAEKNGEWCVYFQDDTHAVFNDVYSAINSIEQGD